MIDFSQQKPRISLSQDIRQLSQHENELNDNIHIIRTSNRDETIAQLSEIAKKYDRGIKIADSYGCSFGDWAGILTSLGKGDLLVACHLEYIDYSSLEYLKTAIYNSKISLVSLNIC